LAWQRAKIETNYRSFGTNQPEKNEKTMAYI